jgi:hypothetical protein
VEIVAGLCDGIADFGVSGRVDDLSDPGPDISAVLAVVDCADAATARAAVRTTRMTVRFTIQNIPISLHN